MNCCRMILCGCSTSKLELSNSDGSEKIIVESWSFFLQMEADDFLCSNIDYGIILSSIEEMNEEGLKISFRISENKSVSANETLLSIISAYDSYDEKNEKLLQFAIDFADIVYRKTGEPFALINKMQAIRRQRPLTNDEISNLVNLRNGMEDNKITKCAIAILLGEKDLANRLLSELSSGDRKLIMDYPIYRLMTEERGER